MNEGKDIISLETAILAKEKGFQEEELHYYFNGELMQHPNRLYYNYNQDNPPLTQYSAPYQSFLQKWLREEHQLFIEIYMFDPARIDYFSVRIIRNKRYDLNLQYPYESYEDALEAGLLEALKLI